MKQLEGSMWDMPIAALYFLIAGIILAIMFILAPQIVAANPHIFSGVFSSVITTLDILVVGVFLVFIFMNLIPIVAAYFVKTHPVFFIISLLVLMVEMLIYYTVSSVFTAFISASVLVTVGNSYLSLLVTVFANLPLIALVFSILLLIAQYSKPVVPQYT